jgi:hypothetical protein
MIEKRSDGERDARVASGNYLWPRVRLSLSVQGRMWARGRAISGKFEDDVANILK